MEIKVLVTDHIEAMETMFETDEFTLSEVIQYTDEILFETYDNIYQDKLIEVIPATRKEFRNGILATVRYQA